MRCIFKSLKHDYHNAGNSLWENKQNSFVAKYITQTNDNNYIFVSPARNEQISLSKMSAKGIIQSDKKVRIDSLQYPSYMYQTKSEKIFIVGQELNGAFDSYDRKMVLLYANENQ